MFVAHEAGLLVVGSSHRIQRIQSCIVIRLGFPSTLEPRLATPAPPPARPGYKSNKNSRVRNQKTTNKRERGWRGWNGDRKRVP